MALPKLQVAAAAVAPVAAADGGVGLSTSASPVVKDDPSAPAVAKAAVAAAAANDGGGVAPTTSSFLKGWGVGLAMLRNKPKVISDAQMVGGLVRANSVQQWAPELLLAKHFYFHHDNGSCVWTTTGCPGVFLGVGVGGASSSQVIDMVGGGFILGFGSSTKDSSADQAHNLGIGVGRRFGMKVLGDGITVNQALPSGETQIRYKTVDITAPFLFYTYKFD